MALFSCKKSLKCSVITVYVSSLNKIKGLLLEEEENGLAVEGERRWDTVSSLLVYQGTWPFLQEAIKGPLLKNIGNFNLPTALFYRLFWL